MKERPILFTGPSTPMVMDGTKTQTRRIVDLDRLSVDLPGEVRSDLWDEMPASERRVGAKGKHRARLNPQGAVFAILKTGEWLGLKPGEFNFRCQLVDGTTHLADHGNGKKVWTVTPVGEQRIWVREAWRTEELDNGTDGIRFPDSAFVRIENSQEAAVQWVVAHDKHGDHWRPGIFMPRWASRTNLIPIQARLMLLRDITDDDARAEGVTFTDYGRDGYQEQRAGWHYGPSKNDEQCLRSPCDGFANAWNNIHAGENWNLKPGPSPWDQNPWVWAYTFRKEAT
jgi:hypothetical protein